RRTRSLVARHNSTVAVHGRRPGLLHGDPHGPLHEQSYRRRLRRHLRGDGRARAVPRLHGADPLIRDRDRVNQAGTQSAAVPGSGRVSDPAGRLSPAWRGSLTPPTGRPEVSTEVNFNNRKGPRRRNAVPGLWNSGSYSRGSTFRTVRGLIDSTYSCNLIPSD